MCDIGNLKHETLRNWFRYETFIHLFEFKGFSTWGERETHNFFLCWLLLHRQLSTQPSRGARSAQSRLASPTYESQPSSSAAGTQLTAFSQISAHASGAWHHPNTLIPIPICDFYFDISEWHILSACAWTPALMLHLTNLCAKWKVLSLTKPKARYIKQNPSAIILHRSETPVRIIRVFFFLFSSFNLWRCYQKDINNLCFIFFFFPCIITSFNALSPSWCLVAWPNGLWSCFIRRRWFESNHRQVFYVSCRHHLDCEDIIRKA